MKCHPQEDSPSDKQTRPAAICLVGMPNSGKTTLMNALTGGHFSTANYPGVTVSLLHGRSKPEFGSSREIVDLPGVHSVVSPSAEEALACAVIRGENTRVTPAAFVLVVDATQLERHLKFAGLVAQQGKPIVIALTMMDLLTRTRQQVSPEALSRALGAPVVPVDPRTGKGVRQLIETLDRSVALDPATSPLASLPEDPIAAFARVRDLLRESGVVTRSREIDPVTARIDRIVLDRYWGFPIFLLILIILFGSIFWAAQPFMDVIDSGFSWLGETVSANLGDSVPAQFLAEGVIGGMGAVAVFFPQILILFFLMTLLEDSGYLARGAALVDRPLAFLGLHGRSFVPMLSGFACAIPAVLAARAIPSRRERFLTIWILPLMSCSARLPVYALLLAALLPGAPLKAGLALAGIYISSLLVGSLVAGLAVRIFSKYRDPSLLAMELPAFRVPRWKPILRMTWARGSSYIKRAGVPIMLVAAVIWIITHFGYTPATLVASAETENSFAAQLGHRMEPALRPMGADWRVGVGLISAFAAREVFVSSLAIMLHAPDPEEDQNQQATLLEAMRKARFPGTDQPIFTTASMLGLVVFFFFSLQCFSTVAVVMKETNSWKLAAAQLVFYTGLGYGLAVASVQGLRALGVA
ncbi:MAG TPA: ferrous iron transporter B [Terriglobia bacterium]|nr:ferrous iron transporter B [Terriglobia bacterium]